MMYSLIDFFFVIFHTLLIIFNVFGWILKKTRLINFITLSLTGASWFILGIFYGWGYCPLTDWHFTILEKLGERNLPPSYIQYLTERLTGVEFSSEFVNSVTAIIFFIVIIISAFMNYRDIRKK